MICFCRRVGLIFCTFLILSCAEDPHKHPDENAGAKRNAQIFKELENAQQNYLTGVTLQNKASLATDANEILLTQKSAQEALNKARSTYIAILRRDDLEKVEGQYNRYEIEMTLIDIDSRLRQLNTASK